MADSRYDRDMYSAYEEVCGKYAGNTLFHYNTQRISFGDTIREVRKRAAFLQGKGFTKGDVVGILASNSPDWCVTFMAVTSSGAVALPLDTNLGRDQHESMLRAAGAKALFVSEQFRGEYGGIPVYDIDLRSHAADEILFRPVSASGEDIAALLFTSGTTGAPKIVSLTHSNLLHIAYVCTDLEEYTERDVTLAILPLFHVYALESTFMAPLLTGSAIVMQNSLKGPDIMKSLADFPVTIFPAAPLMWELFFNAIAAKAKAQSNFKYRLFMFFATRAPIMRALGLGFLVRKVFAPVHEVFGRSHRFFISGGAPLKREYFNYYKNMGFNIMEGYGLSETTGPIAIPYYKKSEAGSVGAPIAGNEVKIKNINEDGIGEIWLRGRAVMPGYYNNDAANRAVFDSEGFFNTGDLGRIDAKGAIRVTGRVKNVIVLDSGKKVYPEEIEFYFRQSELIAEIAVFDRAIDSRTAVYAVIVPRVKSKSSFTALKREVDRLNAGLPEYKRIRRFAVSMDELPKNSTRKLLYGEVKSLLDQGAFQEHEDGESVLRSILAGTTAGEVEAIEALKEKLGADRLFVNQTLADFNIDSLGMIDLIVSIEHRLGVLIDIDEMRRKQNLGETVAYIGSLQRVEGGSLDERILGGEILVRANRFFNPFHHAWLALAGFLSRKLWGLATEHGERLCADNCIIVANHQSYLDMVWIAWSIPPRCRENIYVTGKKRLSFLRYLFPVLPIIYLDEGNAIEVLKANADLLRQGKSLVIFPEGTRTPDGNLQPFKSGAAYLAKNLNRKIIPVSVSGAFDIWPKQRLLPHIFSGGKGKICVGQAIDPRQYDSVESLNAAIESAVRAGISRSTAAPSCAAALN